MVTKLGVLSVKTLRTTTTTTTTTTTKNQLTAIFFWLLLLSPTLVSSSTVHSTCLKATLQQLPYNSSRSRRIMRHSNIWDFPGRSTADPTTTMLLASSSGKRWQLQPQQQEQQQKQLEEKYPDISFRDLGPIGKTVAGVTEIFFAVLFEYVSGFTTGWIFGSIFGLPGLAFRPMEVGVRQPIMTEMTKRLGRMNTRSMSWGKSFGSISATFGGFGVAVKVVRNGEVDVWSNILSSAAAGAFFARKEGPQGMLRAAIIYGGLIYLTSFSGSGGIVGRYTERPIMEF
jgi:hypothetical protein